VIYGQLEGSLNSLMALSNNVVAKLWLDLDLNATSDNTALRKSTKFNSSSSSSAATKLGVLVFTGARDSKDLENAASVISPKTISSKTLSLKS